MTFDIPCKARPGRLPRAQKTAKIRAFSTPFEVVFFWPESRLSARFQALSLGVESGSSKHKKTGVSGAPGGAGNGVLSAGG
jgi:hypothetical protein